MLYIVIAYKLEYVIGNNIPFVTMDAELSAAVFPH